MIPTEINGKTIKALLKSLGYSVRVHTGIGKGAYITAWIPCDKRDDHQLVYSAKPFAVGLRESCLRIVYPNNPALVAKENQPCGNIEPYSISMQRAEWAQLPVKSGVAI